MQSHLARFLFTLRSFPIYIGRDQGSFMDSPLINPATHYELQTYLYNWKVKMFVIHLLIFHLFIFSHLLFLFIGISWSVTGSIFSMKPIGFTPGELQCEI